MLRFRGAPPAGAIKGGINMIVITTPREIISAVKEEILFLDTVSMDIQSSQKRKHDVSFQAAALTECLMVYNSYIKDNGIEDLKIELEVKF